MAITDKELEKKDACSTTSTSCGTSQAEDLKKQAKLEVEQKVQAEKKSSGGCCGG